MAICTGCEREVFRYRVIPGVGDFCKKCQQRLPVEATGDRTRVKSTFPFTTTHLGNGSPVEVESLRHLRKLENRHGVSSVVYN